MAQRSVPNTKQQIIDQAVIDGLAEEVTIELHPGIEDRPRVFQAFTAATAELIRPPLEALITSYRQACQTTSGRAAARLFLENMLEAEA